MIVNRIRQLFKPSEKQAGPFRPMYVESEEVKVYYELNEEELADAITEWINNNHTSVVGTGKVICTHNTDGSGGDNKTVKPKFFEQYQITLEVET
jgi:hypothetical protein